MYNDTQNGERPSLSPAQIQNVSNEPQSAGDGGTTSSLWVENFPRVGACRSHLKEHLMRLALATPGCDVETGPPIVGVTIHISCKYGFIEIRDGNLAEQLVDVFDGSSYFGYPLAVTWARRRAVGAYRRKAMPRNHSLKDLTNADRSTEGAKSEVVSGSVTVDNSTRVTEFAGIDLCDI